MKQKLKYMLFFISFIIEILFIKLFLLYIVNPVIDNILNGFEIGILLFTFCATGITLFFQIKFIKNNKFNSIKTSFSIILLAILTSVIIIPSAVERSKYNKKIESGKTVVKEFLLKLFGEDNTNEMIIYFDGYNDGCHIICTDTPTMEYSVSTPMFQNRFEFDLNEDVTVVLNYDIARVIIDEKNLSDEFTKKLSSSLKGLNDNITIKGYVSNVDIINYTKNDYTINELISRSTYIFDGFYIDVNTFNKEEISTILKNLYIKNNSKLNGYYRYFSLGMPYYVSVNGEFYAHGYVSEEDNEYKITIEGYSSDDSNTIENEIIYLKK